MTDTPTPNTIPEFHKDTAHDISAEIQWTIPKSTTKERNVKDGAMRLIGEAAGEISMCWDPQPTGVFDGGKARLILDRLEVALADLEESE